MAKLTPELERRAAAMTPEIAAELGRKGGSVRSEAKSRAAMLRARKQNMKDLGVRPEDEQFLINFMESGAKARAQVVKMCRDLDETLARNDPEGLKTGSTRAKIQDIVLKAAEHEHGRAALKIQSLNVNLDLTMGEEDRHLLLEQLGRMR